MWSSAGENKNNKVIPIKTAYQSCIISKWCCQDLNMCVCKIPCSNTLHCQLLLCIIFTKNTMCFLLKREDNWVSGDWEIRIRPHSFKRADYGCSEDSEWC